MVGMGTAGPGMNRCGSRCEPGVPATRGWWNRVPGVGLIKCRGWQRVQFELKVRQSLLRPVGFKGTET